MTYDANRLIQIYLARPDLQAVYNADGSPKDPKDPRIAGIPTFMDWVNRFGVQEYPDLDTRNTTLGEFFSPEEIKTMPNDIKTTLSAFVDAQQKNFDSTGKINWEINSKNLEDAMRTAENDPQLLAKYGDELKSSVATVNQTLGMLEQGYTQEQAKIARDQDQERKMLADIEASAGRAYSGFRKQAEDRLALDQTDVIKSTRRQMQSAMQGIVGPLEQRFGTDFLRQGKIKFPEAPGMSYSSIGANQGSDVVGSFDFDKKNEAKDLALSDFYPSTETPQ